VVGHGAVEKRKAKDRVLGVDEARLERRRLFRGERDAVLARGRLEPPLDRVGIGTPLSRPECASTTASNLSRPDANLNDAAAGGTTGATSIFGSNAGVDRSGIDSKTVA
jgi:hypothetical protein